MQGSAVVALHCWNASGLEAAIGWLMLGIEQRSGTKSVRKLDGIAQLGAQ